MKQLDEENEAASRSVHEALGVDPRLIEQYERQIRDKDAQLAKKEAQLAERAEEVKRK